MSRLKLYLSLKLTIDLLQSLFCHDLDCSVERQARSDPLQEESFVSLVYQYLRILVKDNMY
jgi:hypothetical protein